MRCGASEQLTKFDGGKWMSVIDLEEGMRDQSTGQVPRGDLSLFSLTDMEFKLDTSLADTPQLEVRPFTLNRPQLTAFNN